jgi:hypothetical protein
MAISIDGTGTITGISVGGLNDSIITSSELANGAVTVPKVGYNGAVLQVVHTVYGTADTNTTTTLADTGLSLSITPVAANSKILVIVSQAILTLSSSHADSRYANFYILRGSTILEDDSLAGVGYFGIYAAGGTSRQAYGVLPQQILDDPTYTLGDSITYKTQHRPNTNTSGGQTIAQPNDKQSRMTLMEIAA